jgi:hypothetical protein
MPGSATYTIAGQPVDEGAVLRFHTPLVGHVAETPDTADDLVGEPLGARVALHHPAVGEHDLVEALGAWVGIQIAHLRQERLRVDELPQDEREREVVVAGRHHLVGDPPHLHETLVRRDDPALEVDDEDPVGGGLERGAQQEPASSARSFSCLRSVGSLTIASNGLGTLGAVQEPRGNRSRPARSGRANRSSARSGTGAP